MSFREKSAWISFVLLLIVSGIAFWNSARIVAGQAALNNVRLFVLLFAALVIAEVVLHLLLVMQSPKEARAPKDERDHLIAW